MQDSYFNHFGAAFGDPTRAEMFAARTSRPGSNLVRPPAPATPDATRGEGTLTKYRPVGGWTPQAPGANLVANAGEMGEPTSFRGGAGAPAPAEVIRGRNLTYTNPAPAAPDGGYNPTPGTGTAEFATNLQARQGYNRGQAMAAQGAADARGVTDPTIEGRFGSWQAPGSNLLQQGIEGQQQIKSAENVRPEKVAMADAIRQKQDQELGDRAGSDFDKWLHGSSFSTFDQGKGALAFKPKDENMARDALAAKNMAIAQKSGEAGRKHFEERQMVRQWLQTQPLAPNMNVSAMLDAASTNPDHWRGLVEDARKVMGVTQPPAPAPGFFSRENWNRAAENQAPGYNMVP